MQDMGMDNVTQVADVYTDWLASVRLTLDCVHD